MAKADKVLPVSDVPYNHSRVVDGVVYSLDKFRPRFYFAQPRLKPDKVIDAMSLIAGQYAGMVGHLVRHGDGHVGSTVHWWSFDGVVVSLCRRKSFVRLDKTRPYDPDDDDESEFNFMGRVPTGDHSFVSEDVYTLLVEFNPNKHLDNWALHEVLRLCKSVPNVMWDNTRCDYTIDVPYPIDDVRLLSLKQGSCYLGTYYFGTRGKTGYTRVYDKRKEMREKYELEIGHDLTRVEYEVRGSAPVVMDQPYLLGDLGTHEVFRYVPMDRWHDALKTLDPRTARRFKKNSLIEIPFDRSIFDGLYRDLLTRLGLDDVTCKTDLICDSVGAPDESLEQMMCQLRKWAGTPD